MPDRREATLTASAIRRRTERFASLRAAQRALSRSVHPSELALANQQGRELLIQLQALSVRARQAGDPARSDEQEAIDRADLLRVDRLLDEISTRTREILDGLDLSQLRSAVMLLSERHPDEVRGLIDVVVEGDTEDDKNLRMLEYLVTVLSSEERNGRRVVVREPSEVSRRLRDVAQRRLAEGDAEHLIAEKTFTSTMAMLFGAEDLGAIRDRIRRYKEELGSRILDPRILSAAVSYNVAMWNQVDGLIEGSRSIDTLAEELIGLNGSDAAEDPSEPASPSDRPSDAADLLGSAAFDRIVVALGDRLLGRAASDARAGQVVAAYRLEGLQAAEIEAFEAPEDDELARLTRAAVVLSLTIRHRVGVEDSLRALKIDPELLRTRCVDELSAEITAVARKLFTDSRYDDAFRLSEVKTRNLAKIATARAGENGLSWRGGGASRRGKRRPGGMFRFDWGLPSGQVWAALLLLALPLIASLLWSSGGEVEMMSRGELSRISPFLESGFRRQNGGEAQFVGRLGRTWDYLPERERLRVTAEIGIALKDLGIHSVVLEDEWKRVQARYQGKPILEEGLIPAPPP